MNKEEQVGQPFLPRAGFWQRVAAFILDCAIVFIPVAILAGPLFSMTDGRIFLSSPFLKYEQCSSQKSFAFDLKPKPPADSNFNSLCKVYSITGMTANLAVIGKYTVDGNRTTTVSRNYALNRQGEPIQGYTFDLSGFGEIFVLLLIIPMQAMAGQSFGQRVLAIRLISLQSPETKRIALRKLLLRYFLIFFFPSVFLIPLISWWFLPFSIAFALTVLLCVIPIAYWQIGNIALVIQRKDPWFDRMSGLAQIVTKAKPTITPPLPAAPPPLPHP